MEFFLEIVFEVLIGLIFRYPGGFIRWLIFRKRPLKSYINDSISYNLAALAITISVVVLTISAINKAI